MTTTLTTRSRELHEHREALIEAFIESRNLSQSDRAFIYEILEADRDWCSAIKAARTADKLARDGS